MPNGYTRPVEWTITDRERPWTANAERRWHYHERARRVRETRTRWTWLTLAENIPKLDRVSITAQPLARSRRWRADVAACYPSVKAAIDGIVDAGVMEDDDDRHLLSVTFLPVRYDGIDGLRLTITDESGNT
jgi:crossover junction endodeoxyribonuclease RusA